MIVYYQYDYHVKKSPTTTLRRGNGKIEVDAETREQAKEIIEKQHPEWEIYAITPV